MNVDTEKRGQIRISQKTFKKMLWHRMHAVDCGAHRAILSAQTQPNAAELIDGASPCRWITDSDPKHTSLRASYSKEVIILNGQFSYMSSNPTEQLFSY